MRNIKVEYKKEDAIYISKSNINTISKLDWHQWFKFNCVVCGKEVYIQYRFDKDRQERYKTLMCQNHYHKWLNKKLHGNPNYNNAIQADKTFRKNHNGLSMKEYYNTEKGKAECKDKWNRLSENERKNRIRKGQKTYYNKTGYKCSFNNPEVKKKCLKSMIKHHGVKYTAQSKKLRNKMYSTFRKNHNGQEFLDYVKSDDRRKVLDAIWKNKSQEEKNLISERIKESWKNKNKEEIAKRTLKSFNKKIERYGTLNPHCLLNYYGIMFDSKPELAVWIYCIDHNIPIIREPCILYYEYDNKKYRYVPDFMINGELVEIKGPSYVDKFTGEWKIPDYLIRNAKSKKDLDVLYNKNILTKLKYRCAIQNNVKILYKNDYIKYLYYINDKYGSNYLDQFKTTNPYNPSYWCYYINNNTYIPNYYNNSNYIKGIGISPYDINKDSEYTLVNNKGVSPFDINKNNE